MFLLVLAILGDFWSFGEWRMTSLRRLKAKPCNQKYPLKDGPLGVCIGPKMAKLLKAKRSFHNNSLKTPSSKLIIFFEKELHSSPLEASQ